MNWYIYDHRNHLLIFVGVNTVSRFPMTGEPSSLRHQIGSYIAWQELGFNLSGQAIRIFTAELFTDVLHNRDWVWQEHDVRGALENTRLMLGLGDLRHAKQP